MRKSYRFCILIFWKCLPGYISNWSKKSIAGMSFPSLSSSLLSVSPLTCILSFEGSGGTRRRRRVWYALSDSARKIKERKREDNVQIRSTRSWTCSYAYIQWFESMKDRGHVFVKWYRITIPTSHSKFLNAEVRESTWEAHSSSTSFIRLPSLRRGPEKDFVLARLVEEVWPTADVSIDP